MTVDISFLLGIFGIAVSILAIMQAIYYYDKSRDSQNVIDKSLAELKAQTDHIRTFSQTLLSRALKTISGIAENSKGPSEQIQLTQILSALGDIKKEQNQTAQSPVASATNAVSGHGLPQMPDPLSKELLQSEAISAVGQVFMYAGLTNIYAQYLLPPRSDLAVQLVTNPTLKDTVQVVNVSFQSCNEAYAWLKAVSPELLRSHQLLPSLQQYEALFGQQLRGSETAFDYWEAIRKK